MSPSDSRHWAEAGEDMCWRAYPWMPPYHSCGLNLGHDGLHQCHVDGVTWE